MTGNAATLPLSTSVALFRFKTTPSRLEAALTTTVGTYYAQNNVYNII